MVRLTRWRCRNFKQDGKYFAEHTGQGEQKDVKETMTEIKDKNICAAGTIKNYQGKPEIVVEKEGQVKCSK